MPFAPRPIFDWRLRTRTLTLGRRTLLMAIVNLTPDSFSGDGLYTNVGAPCPGSRTWEPSPSALEKFVSLAIHKLEEGADILDLGAESTRPNAQPITADEEQARLLPVLEALHAARPDAVLSVDTYHSSTALAAANAGAEIINDVSGLLWDSNMAATVATTQCGFVLMHTRCRPTEWTTLPPLANDKVLPFVLNGLREQLATAQSAGIAPENIVIDPGFGFGKIGPVNYALLANLSELHHLGHPILIGLSRKGFLGRTSEATVAANTAAVLQGAHIVRIHDVAAHHAALTAIDATLNA